MFVIKQDRNFFVKWVPKLNNNNKLRYSHYLMDGRLVVMTTLLKVRNIKEFSAH